MEIAILLALILLNGLFAMSEIALVTARKARLQRQIENGDRGAIAAAKLGEDPTRFLSTVQIGITSIGVLNGVVGEATLAQPLGLWLQGFGISETTAGYVATAIVVAGLTYFSIVLGELVPKRLGQMAPEAIARLVARPIGWLAVASTPFVKLLSSSTRLVLRLLGTKVDRGPGVTEEEIHALLVEGSEAGVIEQHEHTMVRNVFRLDDRQLASLMVPRGDVVYLDVEASMDENLRRIEESDHSRFPVVRGGMHDIIGVVSARQLLARRLRGEEADLQAAVQPAVFVPESVTGMELLENFRASGGQIAFVIDEYGEVLGLVTLQDLIEAITGEFKAEAAGEQWAVQRDDGSWLLDGLIPIPELKDRIGLRQVPEEEKERYHTLSGMLLLLLGRLPQIADTVQWGDWRFEIVDMDGKRIDKVLAERLPPQDGPEEETTG
ncbi:hemolysin family protein [Cupriavidus alkaliphilus]|uniref:Putative hemolysin n=1 Tax=Cupriavidus alkaliphilus TaxID=942866 RepID=A0A1C3W2R9_9BURK|nr:hemolysin family protein [Cupriavidus alkaliphilus]MBB2917299.1 putative hemolysin [Cupriavidus alkaliphilus]MBB3009271.1 putative hemolysin [Cupriavidus alkaliphilus]MBB3015466.1 putative hemolysin [Cupriavidus alkaliphilus]PVY69660.1 putative hemolysin [Cupriavidus alkaliphilus]RAS00327.1 putative hemolysin [Cupriavidus alkaliphilus]